MKENQNAEGLADTDEPQKETYRVLILGALGVVYGDIGTSPIYAFREALHAASTDGSLFRADVLGIISMIFWALTLIVTIKYILFVLRADNDGEGGILSLMALARESYKTRPRIDPWHRHCRCFFVLWRCSHHPGNFGSIGC